MYNTRVGWKEAKMTSRFDTGYLSLRAKESSGLLSMVFGPVRPNKPLFQDSEIRSSKATQLLADG